jgi:hypothetical protein
MRGGHKMTLATPGVKSTPGVNLAYADFVRFPDDGLRHELLYGDYYVTPAGDVLTTSLLPDLDLPLARIFRD